MCHSHNGHSCFGCSHSVSRRRFVANCGGALAALGGSRVMAGLAEDPKQDKVRVGLVFLSKPASWPWPTFDAKGREKEIINLLTEGCPGIEFVPTVIQKPDDVQKAIAMKDDVDGYLIYIVTLNWDLQRSLTQIGRLGKPLIVADEYIGGSGVFLRGYSDLCRAKLPAVGVASTREDDLVTVARCFADVKKPGATPASFAERCQEVYSRTFPAVGPMDCLRDDVSLTDMSECVKRFKDTRFLIVGAGSSGQEREFLGAKGIYLGFDELQSFYEKVDRDQASEWAARWSQKADKIVEPTDEWINKAARVYLATLDMLAKYDTRNVTMNCLGGFAGGHLPAYPCLGFMQILNDGGQGVCEAMPDDTLSMLMARILTGRPGFVSDPILDTAKNQIVYAHCVATTKVFGASGEENMYRIRTLHNRDPRGTCTQSFMPQGFMTTSFRTNFALKQMVIHQAKAAGNLDSERGCRSQLIGEVHGDIGKLFDQWDRFSWHRVTVFGDVKEPLIEFGKALGLEIVVEA